MLFSELILEKVVLELRYDNAHLFWDNSGKAMMRIGAKYPKLEIVNAQISNVQSSLWDEGIVLNFNNLKADVTQDYPSSLETFKGVSSAVCEAVSEYFDVKSYNRIGVRYIFIYPLGSKEVARDFVLKLGLVALPPERLQPFGNVKTEEQQVMIRFEDEDRGYAFRLSHAPRDITLNISRPIVANTEKFQKNVVIFDLDCFTKKKVEAPVFVPADFIRITYKTVENNLLRLAGL